MKAAHTESGLRGQEASAASPLTRVCSVASSHTRVCSAASPHTRVSEGGSDPEREGKPAGESQQGSSSGGKLNRDTAQWIQNKAEGKEERKQVTRRQVYLTRVSDCAQRSLGSPETRGQPRPGPGCVDKRARQNPTFNTK